MSAAAQLQVGLRVTPSDFRGIPRKVAVILCELVNKHGVRYRIQQGGGHVFLYNGNQQERPYKISGSRPEETTLTYLFEWIEENVPEYGEREVTASDLEVLADALTTEPKEDKIKSPQGDPRDSMEPMLSSDGKPSGFVTDGEKTYCTQCGFERDGVSLVGLHLHRRSHEDPDAVAEMARKAGKVRKLNREQSDIMVEQALAVIARKLGFKVSAKGTDDPEKAELKKKVADLEAKLKLINEAMRL